MAAKRYSITAVLFGLLFGAVTCVAQQQAPVVYVVGNGVYNLPYWDGGGPDTPWPSLNFTLGDSSNGISINSAIGASGGTVSFHGSSNAVTPAYWRSIGGVSIYVRGNPGTPYHLQWSCNAAASVNTGTTGLFQTLADTVGGGCSGDVSVSVLSYSPPYSQSRSASNGGTIDGTTSGSTVTNPAFPGVTYSYATSLFGQWIYVACSNVGGSNPLTYVGSASLDYSSTFTASLVRPNQIAPTAVIGPIGGVSQNVAVTLSGSNSHANTVGASIIEYRWDIQKADGTDTLFGSPISYSWNTAGTYLVTLTVTDSDGLTGSTNAVVTVFPPKMCAVDALTPLASLVQQYPELYQGSTFGLELNPIDTVHLQLNMQTALACFQGGIQGSGGTFVLKSAYRTNAYQAHLREVWDKWLALQPLAGDPTCAQVYSDVQAEFNKHGIVHRPASADLGPHTTGSAIDVCADGIAQSACAGSVPNPILSVTQTLNMADGCGLYRPVPTDPVHFVHK